MQLASGAPFQLAASLLPCAYSQAAMGLQRAAVRLVEEQQGLAAVRQPRQLGQPAQPAAGLQAAPQAAANQQGAGILLPAWQPAAVGGMAQQQQQQQQLQQQREAGQRGSQEEGLPADQPGSGGYAEFLAVALQLLQESGGEDSHGGPAGLAGQGARLSAAMRALWLAR